MAYGDDSMYLIIEAVDENTAKQLFLSACLAAGLSERNYQYIVGDIHIGYSNGTIIRNNNVISRINDEYYLLEFDKNIVATYGVLIQAEIEDYLNMWFLEKCQVYDFLPVVVQNAMRGM
jgi:hypothetical protein